jgi:hypothetical protein
METIKYFENDFLYLYRRNQKLFHIRSIFLMISFFLQGDS